MTGHLPTLRLHRRAILAGALALLPGRGRSQDADAWARWRDAFVAPSGRVIDDRQGGISHSEGQAYGLMLAQAYGDRDTFEAIEAWTRATLATRQDALMAWAWRDGGVADWRNATDGDLLRGWALLRADRDSGWGGHRQTAEAIARALVEICLAPDPRAPDERLLRPADLARADAVGVLVNPSYYVGRALRELGEASGQPVLLRTADHGETLLADPAALRDWVLVTPQGLQPAPGLEDRFGWDGLRIPLYLWWSGRWDHPALQAAAQRFDLASAAGHVAAVTDAAGRVMAETNAPGFLAVAALARGMAPPPPDVTAPATDYYAETLALLAQVAWRESGVAAAK